MKEIGDVVKVGQTVKVTVIPSTDGRLSFTMRYTAAGNEGSETSGKDLKLGKVATRGGAPSCLVRFPVGSCTALSTQQIAQCKCCRQPRVSLLYQRCDHPSCTFSPAACEVHIC